MCITTLAHCQPLVTNSGHLLRGRKMGLLFIDVVTSIKSNSPPYSWDDVSCALTHYGIYSLQSNHLLGATIIMTFQSGVEAHAYNSSSLEARIQRQLELCSQTLYQLTKRKKQQRHSVPTELRTRTGYRGSHEKLQQWFAASFFFLFFSFFPPYSTRFYLYFGHKLF